MGKRWRCTAKPLQPFERQNGADACASAPFQLPQAARQAPSFGVRGGIMRLLPVASKAAAKVSSAESS